jgi:hypothetical protein
MGTLTKMKNEKKYHTQNIFIAILIFLMMNFSGCAILEPLALEVGIHSDKKSIIVIPVNNFKYGQVVWGKVGDNSSKNYFQTDVINSEFLITPADSGVYYIKGAHIQGNRSYNLVKTGEYNSTLGDISIQKFKNNLFKKQDSYYVINYDFKDISNNYNEIGTITVGENETILIPAIWIDIVLAENACNEFYILADEYSKKTYRTKDAIYIGEWFCPIKAFLLSIKTKPINYFLSQITPDKRQKMFDNDDMYLSSNNKKLLYEKLEKIIVRDFEKGTFFKKAKKIESFYKDTEQYIIYGE